MSGLVSSLVSSRSFVAAASVRDTTVVSVTMGCCSMVGCCSIIRGSSSLGREGFRAVADRATRSSYAAQRVSTSTTAEIHPYRVGPLDERLVEALHDGGDALADADAHRGEPEAAAGPA